VTRVVLLGASNVTLGFGTISRLIRAGFDGPLDLRCALGHGRSYGAWTTAGPRGLPAITRCGLWPSLAEDIAAPTFALVTDVGNDLIYGSEPERIARWVEACLQRLSACNTRIVLTRLPIARIERLSALRYHATRMSFFPFRKAIGWPEMLDRVRELDASLGLLANRYGASLVEQPLDWYGFDPIHIRWKQRPRAWTEILSHWPGYRRPTDRRSTASLSLIGRFPHEYRLLGRRFTAAQPTASRHETTLSLY
jgi:hypothetical protein